MIMQEYATKGHLRFIIVHENVNKIHLVLWLSKKIP